MVDFEVSLLDGVALDDAPGLIWPTYLQFREAGTNTWQNVTDIEGQLVKFGQTQVNDWTISTDGGGAFNRSGVIDDKVKSRSTVANGDYDPFNAAEAYNYGRPTSLVDTDASLTATCRQMFAVGMCQAYRNQSSFSEVVNAPDKLGDYRLTVRYPGGRNQEYTTSASAYADTVNNPALSVGYCPPPPYNDYGVAQQTQQVKLQFGDFYNPFQFNVKGNSISFAYRVSKQGNIDKNQAGNLNPTIQVYAREWSLKYISRFFLDSRLTQPWEPGTTGTDNYNGQEDNWYYTISPYIQDDTNAIYGTDYSNVQRETFTAYNPLDPDSTNWTNANRKWVGQFTPLGIKIMGTCEPFEYLAESPVVSSGPPATGGGFYNCGSAFSLMPNYYELDNTTPTGQWLLIKTGNAREIVCGEDGIPISFVFGGDDSINPQYNNFNGSSVLRAKNDAIGLGNLFVDPNPDWDQPVTIVNSGSVFLWRINGTDYVNYIQIQFNKPPTGSTEQSIISISPLENSPTWNTAQEYTVTITNCRITNLGSNNQAVKRQPSNYGICDPKA